MKPEMNPMMNARAGGPPGQEGLMGVPGKLLNKFENLLGGL